MIGPCSTVAGQEDCWLLTETLIQTASLQLKVCPNLRCLALHSFADLHPGNHKHSAVAVKQICIILSIICFNFEEKTVLKCTFCVMGC